MKQVKWIFSAKSNRYEWFVFRNTFSYSGEEEVMMEVSALGKYVLYLNGQYVARGPVKSYDFNKIYDEIEITPFLQEGMNTVAILSQKIYTGGIYGRITSNENLLLCTDESWKAKRYEALSSTTAAISPPVEPVPLNEEWVDARLDREIVLPSCDDSSWERAVYVYPEFQKMTKNNDGLLSETPLFPEKYLGAAAIREEEGLKLRFHRDCSYHKISKYVSELYACVLCSDVEQELEFVGTLIGKRYLNGCPFEDTLKLKRGENLLLFHHFSTGGDSEFILKGAKGVSLKELSFGEKQGQAGFLVLTTHDTHFSWTYPDSDPHKGTGSTEKMEEFFSAKTFFDLTELHRFSLAEICDITTGFRLLHDQYGEISGHGLDTSLKLPLTFSASEHFVKRERCMMSGNSEYATVSPNTVLFFDFGSERLGYLWFELCAKEGTVLDFECFEVVDFDGMRHHEKCCMKYICRNGWQKYTSVVPRGFRYLAVTVWNSSEPVKIKTICLNQSVAMISSQGCFECDNPAINNIYQMCTNSALACMSDTYVDCPGFEQVYWMGDAKVTAHVNLVNFGAYEYDLKCLEMAAQSLTEEYKRYYRNDNDTIYDEDKYLVTPAFGNYVYHGLPLWSMPWIHQIYDYYLYSGDKEGVRRLYPYVQKMLSNCENMMSDRGLFHMEGAWNLIEWAENDLLPCGEVTANSMELAMCYERTAYLAQALGDKDYADICKEKEQALKKAINQYCWDEEHSAYVDTVRDEYGYQLYLDFFEKNGLDTVSFEEFKKYSRVSEQTNILGFVCGCVPEERREGVGKIVKRIAAEDYKRFKADPRYNFNNKDRDNNKIVAIGSPYFLYYSFRALTSLGEYDAILKVMEREYGFMLQCGTKTCWETFYTPGMSYWTRSICHGWGASPAVYLLTDICGIKPVKPGFEEFVFQPNLGSLTRVKCEVPTPYGKIRVEIDKNLDICNVTYPKECKMLSI